MSEWINIGGNWAYRIWHDDVLLQHQCGPDKKFAALASDHQKVSIDPLTLSPSVLCQCGAHGFIRDGKWVAA